jgi:hypothetical protein
MWPCFPAPFRLLYQTSSQKKLPSFLGTPYLVTKLRIKSEHFSANPNQILPNAHDYFSSSQRNAVVQCCSYIQQRLKKTCNTLCARWQMMANGVIQGSARRRQLTQLVRLEVKSDASLHRPWWSPDMSVHVWVTLDFMVDAYSNCCGIHDISNTPHRPDKICNHIFLRNLSRTKTQNAKSAFRNARSERRGVDSCFKPFRTLPILFLPPGKRIR